MEFIAAKGLLTPVRDDPAFFPRAYNLNLYRGCCHGCIYCDSRSVCYNLEHFERVRGKRDALPLLEEELRRKRKPGMVATGAMSDPYNPFEAQYGLTRGALALLARFGFGAGLTTKSSLAARDRGALQAVRERAPAYVTFSITTLDEQLCARIEPYASPTSQRFAALEQLSAAGLCTGVWINPVLPFLTDSPDNLLGLVRRAADCGAQYMSCYFGMTLRAGSRDYYYQALDRCFPGLRAQYERAYGNRYVCECPEAWELWQAYGQTCQALGLAYQMPDIRRRILRSQVQRQVSLWEQL